MGKTGIWARWLLALGVIVGAGWALRLTVLAPAPVPVQVFRAERGTVEETITNSRAGTVRSRRDARISVETAGRVVELCAREGERVKAGAPLLRLDETEAIASLALAERRYDTAKALLEESKALHEDARLELERQRKLKDVEGVSQAVLDRLGQKLEAAAAQVDASRARLAQEEAARELARAQRDKVVLRAPFDGVVAERNIEVGEWATPALPGLPGTPVMRLIDPDALYVRAELDEVDLGRVAENLSARVLLDPYRGRSFAGRVVRVAPFVSDVEAQNRTLEIEVEMDAPPPGLKPGTSADVEVILQARGDALRIPAYALLEGKEGKRVLVADGGTARARDVEVGLRNWEFVQVSAGLDVGAAVIVSLDREEVKDGARIRILP
jgi:HlyD family secretion protein